MKNTEQMRDYTAGNRIAASIQYNRKKIVRIARKQ